MLMPNKISKITAQWEGGRTNRGSLGKKARWITVLLFLTGRRLYSRRLRKITVSRATKDLLSRTTNQICLDKSMWTITEEGNLFVISVFFFKVISLLRSFLGNFHFRGHIDTWAVLPCDICWEGHVILFCPFSLGQMLTPLTSSSVFHYVRIIIETSKQTYLNRQAGGTNLGFRKLCLKKKQCYILR